MCRQLQFSESDLTRSAARITGPPAPTRLMGPLWGFPWQSGRAALAWILIFLIQFLSIYKPPHLWCFNFCFLFIRISFKCPKCLQALSYQQRERRQTVMPVHSVCGSLPLSDGHSAGCPLRDGLAFCTESAQRLGKRNLWWRGRPRKANTHRRSSVRDHIGLVDSLESSGAGAM